NSGLWTPNITCDVVLHETMHVLGLVDEYQETSDGAIVGADGKVRFVDDIATAGKGETAFNEQDCRIQGPSDSLMAHQYAAYDKYKQSYHVVRCNCATYFAGRKPMKNCEKKIAGLMKPGLTACPKGTMTDVGEYDDDMVSKMTVGQPFN